MVHRFVLTLIGIILFASTSTTYTSKLSVFHTPPLTLYTRAFALITMAEQTGTGNTDGAPQVNTGNTGNTDNIGNTGANSNTGITGNSIDEGSMVQKLQAELARLQALVQSQAASTQVPPSVCTSSQAKSAPAASSNSTVTQIAQDPVLQALNFD